MKTLLVAHPVDIITDFSSAKAIHTYGRLAASRHITIISAISQYGEEEKRLLEELGNRTKVFWSPNITLGVNYLLFASKLPKKMAPWVDVRIVEEHFKSKEGVSGTAVKVAEALDMDEADISSIRADGILGKHEVIFGFPYQTMRLVHESISREAFGNGVVFAAENLVDKRNGLYSFDDLLASYLESRPQPTDKKGVV